VWYKFIANIKYGRPTSTPGWEGEQLIFYKVLKPLSQYKQKLTMWIVLRRARPEGDEKERKTASGRTFKVQTW
jgi:hypothetical protein